MGLALIMKKKVLCAAAFFYFILLCQLNNQSFLLVNSVKRLNRRRYLYFSRSVGQGAPFRDLRKKRGQLRHFARSSSWWDIIVLGGKLNDAEWKENFRVSKDVYNLICIELKAALHPKLNKLNIYWKRKKQLSVEKKVAVGLYYLASCCEYRVVATQFGIHKMTVAKTIYEFVKVVIKVLTPKYIKFPNEAEALENSTFFEAKSKIPNIIGAIDGTHIPILPPSEGYRDYINRKGWPSMILQAIVGPKYEFLDISVKQPGSSHDMAAFISSNFYKNVQQVMPKASVMVNGRELPYVIIGDPAYPLLPWLLKGFSGPNLTPTEDSFNTHLNSARVVVEIAFGRLKARWRRLLKRVDVHHSFVPYIVAACCTLHNILEKYNDDIVGSWLQAVEEAELLLQQPTPSQNRLVDDYEGYELRIFLSEYLGNK